MKTMTPLLLIACSFGSVASSTAHEGDCPYCKLKLVQNTKDQARYKSDLVVYAPGEKIGEPVVMKRTDGKWTAPEGAVFLDTFKKHADCCAQARAFAKRDGFDAYVDKNKVPDAKPLTLDQFIDKVNKTKDDL